MILAITTTRFMLRNIMSMSPGTTNMILIIRKIAFVMSTVITIREETPSIIIISTMLTTTGTGIDNLRIQAAHAKLAWTGREIDCINHRHREESQEYL